MKEPDQAPLRILCLEDSPTDRRLVDTELKNIGIPFKAVHACNRTQFEAALAAGKADLILSDFNLPAYDGITAHKAARKLQPETPFLIVSGTIGEERAVEVLKAGVTDYVNKERLERLGSAVRRALDEARERAARKQAEIQLSTFSALGQRLSAATTAREAAQTIVDAAQSLLGWDACLLELYSPAEDVLTHVMSADAAGSQRSESSTTAAGRRPSPPIRKAIKEGGHLMRAENSSRTNQADSPAGGADRPLASMMFVPIRNGKSVTGVLSIQSYKPAAYNGESLATLQALADHCGSALDRIRTEEAHRRAEEELQKAQRQLNHVLAQSPAAIYSLRLEGTVRTLTWMSENLERLMGFKAMEARQPGWWFDHVHPADREAAERQILQLLEQTHIAREYRFQHSNGSYRWIRDEQRLIRDASGKPVEIIGSWMDVTERKQLEEQFRQAQKMEAVGQLAGGVAHDFNNMLVVMRCNAELVLMDGEGISGDSRESLKQVILATERAANLTRQLLAFSRKQVMQSRPLSLNQVIADIVKMLNRIIGEGMELECSYENRLPSVQADPGMMEQVLLNLVVNARDAMPEGGRILVNTASVTFDSLHPPTHPDGRLGDFAALTVTDSGTGIAPEHVSRIFEPFFTTKGPGKGTGLGLATVYGIVKQHDGWVELSTQVGRGTTFRILLPAIPSVAAVALPQQKDAAPRGGTERILVVEDDPSSRALVLRLLSKFGYVVREAANSREALEIWRADPAGVDLLLTDLLTGGALNGRQLAEKLRETKPELRVVFMSGYSPEVAGKDTEFIRRHKTFFVQKPYQSRHLVEIVRQCLDET